MRRPRVHYAQRTDGEAVPLRLHHGRVTYYIKCCDCGLRHKLTFNVKGSLLTMRAWRLK